MIPKLTMFLTILLLAGLVAPAADKAVAAVPQLTAAEKAPLLELLLEYSAVYRRKVDLYQRTVAPIDQELRAIDERVQEALTKLNKPGYTLDVGSCLADAAADRKLCLSYLPKPPEKPTDGKAPTSKEAK